METPPLPPPLPPGSALQSGPPSAAAIPRWKRLVFAPIKFLLGMVFMQSPLGAVILTGWTGRLMQRVMLRSWWKAARRRGYAKPFVQFVAEDAATSGHEHWPNAFARQNFSRSIREHPLASGRMKAVFSGLLRSLWDNGRIGVQMALNTSLVLLPSLLLMWSGWFTGWQISFNKAYEHFAVGASVSWLGILLFIAGMFYAPMALARQASTGDWRRFYDFRLVRTLVKRAWLGHALLAAGYFVASVPVMVFIVGPSFFGQQLSGDAVVTPEQVREELMGYYFLCALWVMPAFVGLRMFTAALYARTLLKAVQSGALPPDSLTETEWRALHRLDLLAEAQPPRRSVWARIALWFGTRAGRLTGGFLTALLWFLVLALPTYIGTFFNYRFAFSWLNQPLVLLPWFHHLPAHIESQWHPLGVAALVLFGAWRLARLARWLQLRTREDRPATRASS